MRPVRIALVLAAAAGALTCGSEPTAGELVGSLETQRTDAEAVRFVIHATPPNEVESVTAACNQCQTYQSLDGPNELRGIVVGSIGAGPVFRALVNDIDAVSGYQVEVIEVADGGYVLLPTGDFRITMGR